MSGLGGGSAGRLGQTKSSGVLGGGVGRGGGQSQMPVVLLSRRAQREENFEFAFQARAARRKF